MATKRTHSESESAAAQPETSEETFSMVDILAEQDELEESASAVLGGSDDKHCTYLQGYVNRQALYSCKTCSNSSEKGSAGVCLACCLMCHEGHELVELYTKRNFRCDCGNSKFPEDFKCKLEPTKSENPDNTYNQNFIGNYCTCHRPYPDHDDSIEDEMIQCLVCEDWYHSRHLGTKPPVNYTEMACDACVSKNNILQYYSLSKDLVNVEDNECFLKEFSVDLNDSKTLPACFFDSAWRSKLCKCVTCLSMYDEKNIMFITDEEDSVEAYEKKGLQQKTSQYEKGMQELSKLDRVQQVEVLSEYHDLKSELRDYLALFASSGKVVTKDHITEFFEKMKNKKKRKVVVPTNCR